MIKNWEPQNKSETKGNRQERNHVIRRKELYRGPAEHVQGDHPAAEGGAQGEGELRSTPASDSVQGPLWAGRVRILWTLSPRTSVGKIAASMLSARLAPS